MKKFKFRLESALSLRRFRKQQAALTLSVAIAARMRSASNLERRKAAFNEAEKNCMPRVGETVTAAEMVCREASLLSMDEEIKVSMSEWRENVESEGLCYQELMEARKEEEGLLRLKGKAKEDHRLEMERVDEQAVQEFVNARHQKEPY